MSDQVIFGRQHVGIMSAESVGNYGVRWGHIISCHIFLMSFCRSQLWHLYQLTHFFCFYLQISSMTHCCLRVGYSLMICTRQGSSHGITCIIWVLISSVWCEVTSKLWESTDSVGIPKEGNEGNDSPYSLDNLAFCCMDCFVRLGLPCIRRFVHLSVLDVNT